MFQHQPLRLTGTVLSHPEGLGTGYFFAPLARFCGRLAWSKLGCGPAAPSPLRAKFSISLFRLAAALLAAGGGWKVHAQEQTTPAVDPVEAELAAIGLPPLRSWDLTGNLRTAFGHKQNLLLSAVRPQDSTFAQVEGEVFWWRMPTERFEAFAFVNATLTRFFESDENPREWQAFAHGEARWFLPRAVQVTAAVESYHLDQVFDLSATDAERLTARLAVTGGLASTALRWDLRPHTWVELKPTAQRDRYHDGSDDNWQHIGRATVGHGFSGGRYEVALSAQALRRTYDFRPQYTTAGRPLAGTDLVFQQHEGEARLGIAWDEARRWSTTTAAVMATNRDNGSGYFDYQLRTLRQEIAWTRTPWKVRLNGRASRYDYDVQTEGIGINPPKRMKEEYLAQVRLERKWGARVRLYADWAWERSRSNDPLARYRVKTTFAGVDVAF